MSPCGRGVGVPIGSPAAASTSCSRGRSQPPALALPAVCHDLDMSARRLARLAGISVVMTWAALNAPVYLPAAAADPCADVAVVFARGTHQAPGLGNIGHAFVDSL